MSEKAIEAVAKALAIHDAANPAGSWQEMALAALAAAQRAQSPDLEADMHCQWCGQWHSSVLGAGGCPPKEAAAQRVAGEDGEVIKSERERCELIVYRMKNDAPRAFDYLIDKAAADIRNGPALALSPGKDEKDLIREQLTAGNEAMRAAASERGYNLHPKVAAEAVARERDRCLKILEEWLVLFGEKDPKYVSAQTWATDAIRDISDAIREHTPVSPGKMEGWREPDGWKLVPVEPTQHMLDEVCSDVEPFTDVIMTAIYRNMIVAAPSPPISSRAEDVES